jgi:hypothetical protein
MRDEINVLTPNPLMDALRIPGETFRLPSRGLFCEDGVLDGSVVNGEVEVYPMTTIDEIIISTPDKLLSGKAITEIFARCIPQITDASKLLAKDVDFLMVCLRMVSFGRYMDVTYTHNCELPTPPEGTSPELITQIHEKYRREHTYSVDLQSMINKAKSIDPTTLNQEYVITLANGQVVTLKPMSYGDVIKLYQNTMLSKEDTTDEAEAEKLIVETILSVVKHVNGINNPEHLRQWATKLPLGMRRKIQESITNVSSWGIEMDSPQMCKDCKKPIVLKISANPVSFFS